MDTHKKISTEIYENFVQLLYGDSGLIGEFMQKVDSSPHMIAFHAEVTGANEESTNFFVDQVRIPGTPSICAAITDQVFSDGFESL